MQCALQEMIITKRGLPPNTDGHARLALRRLWNHLQIHKNPVAVPNTKQRTDKLQSLAEEFGNELVDSAIDDFVAPL